MIKIRKSINLSIIKIINLMVVLVLMTHMLEVIQANETLNAALEKKTDAGVINILFIGDSLTAGYGVNQDVAYPAIIQNTFNHTTMNVNVINAGISGATTASIKSVLQWHLSSKPDMVFLALGANDGLRGLSLEQSKENLSEAIETAKAYEAIVMIAGMKLPVNYGTDYRAEFEAMYEQLVQRHDVHWLPFLLEGVAAQPKLNLPDGIHPNEQGHQVIAEHVLSFLKPIVADLTRAKE